jgi:hypothetical protein
MLSGNTLALRAAQPTPVISKRTGFLIMNIKRSLQVFGVISCGILFVLALLFAFARPAIDAQALSPQAGVPRYVATSGLDAANDCSNSAAPCRTIQHALDASQDGDEIHVAQGTYTDALGTVALITKSVMLQGGWNVGFSLYDPALYPTTLDGQFANSVIFISSPITTTPIAPTIDGFIVTRGLGQYNSCPTSWVGSQCGGGIASKYAIPIIVNNVITNNLGGNGPDGNGGGILLFGGGTPAAFSNNAVISHNVIISNAANIGGGGYGGGLYLVAAHIVLVGNQIVSNTASTAGEGAGGGVLVSSISTYALIQNNVIEFNVGSTITTTYGAGLEIYYSQANVISNSIRYNTTHAAGIGSTGGGVMIVGSTPIVTLTDNVIANNVSHYRGGGVYVSVGNTARVILDHNDILSNTAGVEGGGLWIQRSTAILNNIIAYNQVISTTAGRGAGIRAYGSGLITISHNEVYSNSLPGGGGGGLDISSPAVIDSNAIHHNQAADWGGGVVVADTTQPVTLTNNVIAANSGSSGIDAINFGDIRIINNTVVDNSGTGIDVLAWPITPTEPFTATIVNNVVFNNSDCGIQGQNGLALIADYNDVYSNAYNYCSLAYPPAGTHNISADPQFVSASTGNYHLAFGSPAMNAGTNTNAPIFDKDGVIRPQMGKVDMGAYEVVAPYTIYLPLTLKSY